MSDVPLLTWDQEQIARVQNVIQVGTPGTRFDNHGHGNHENFTPPIT
jgi:hypothetical protein